MHKYLKQNIIKNLILLFLLAILYFPINVFLSSSNLSTDTATAGDVVVVMSIIAVTACFGNFSFTYEKIKGGSSMLLAHFTTAILMLIIGLSLIFTSILTSFLLGPFIILDALFALLYVAIVAYDFWDILRLIQK